MVNGIPDSSLYRDSMHLNPKGGKLLGTNIRQKLTSVLNLSENNIESEAVPSDTQQADFHKGRQQGGDSSGTGEWFTCQWHFFNCHGS